MQSREELRRVGSACCQEKEVSTYDVSATRNTRSSRSSGLPDKLCRPLRGLVSQNRRRFVSSEFDLDLTYITDRIIAMGYPAETPEAIYRNSLHDTRRFLEQRHASHYKVFNLRGNWSYNSQHFGGRVLTFEMDDHQPPRLELVAPFCREVDAYLRADPRNVVAVHCKAGKGRTGVMICSFLCYISFYPSPRQNMDYYSCVRTLNNRGVTIPSQRRYVYYFSHLRRARLNYCPLRVRLVGVYFERPPKQHGGLLGDMGIALRVVSPGGQQLFVGRTIWLSKEMCENEDAAWNNRRGHADDSGEEEEVSRRCFGWTIDPDVFLEGDIRFELAVKHKLWKPGKRPLGHVWLNTMFLCPAYCGGPCVHGDEAHPYPSNGSSSIAESTDSTSVRIIPPPGLDEHCPPSSLNLLFPCATPLNAPRYGIQKMLKHAHNEGLVKDVYNDCRRALEPPANAAVVEAAEDGIPNSNGPRRLIRHSGWHVHSFPAREIDGMHKTLLADSGFNLHIVTRCLRESEVSAANEALQNSRNSEGQTRRKSSTKSKEQMSEDGTKVRLTKASGENCNGNEDAQSEGVGCTEDGVYSRPAPLHRDCAVDPMDPRRTDAHWSRFLFRQRADSPSRYPPPNHRCPLLAEPAADRTVVPSRTTTATERSASDSSCPSVQSSSSSSASASSTASTSHVSAGGTNDAAVVDKSDVSVGQTRPSQAAVWSSP